MMQISNGLTLIMPQYGCNEPTKLLYANFEPSRRANVVVFPENNSHPLAQIKKVMEIILSTHHQKQTVLITHSDFIVKQINCCLMFFVLPKEQQKQLASELSIPFYYGLNPDCFSAYILERDNTFTPVQLDEFGMKASSFDKAISQINNEMQAIGDVIQLLKKSK